MGWELIPWYSITNDFDADFGVDEVARPPTRSSATATRSSAPTSSTREATRRLEPHGATSTTALGRQEDWEDSPRRLSADPAMQVVELP